MLDPVEKRKGKTITLEEGVQTRMRKENSRREFLNVAHREPCERSEDRRNGGKTCRLNFAPPNGGASNRL